MLTAEEASVSAQSTTATSDESIDSELEEKRTHREELFASEEKPIRLA